MMVDRISLGKVDNYLKNGSDVRLNNFAKASESLFNFETDAGMKGLSLEKSAPAPDNIDADPDWVNRFANYKPKNRAKYNNVKELAEKFAKKLNRNANVVAITNMVCAVSEQYGLDPEITMSILAHESAFRFDASVMSSREKYNGVMQVDNNTLQTLFANYDDRTDKTLPDLYRRQAGDARYWEQDSSRVMQLRQRYKNYPALRSAVRKDPVLGLEIGIIAFKMKLARHKGNVQKALGEYCGNQYHLDPACQARIKMNYGANIPRYSA